MACVLCPPVYRSTHRQAYIALPSATDCISGDTCGVSQGKHVLQAISCTLTEWLSNYHSLTIFFWYTSNRMVCPPMSCDGSILHIFVKDHYMIILICSKILDYFRCFASNYFLLLWTYTFCIRLFGTLWFNKIILDIIYICIIMVHYIKM
jgi:hypothetical protein